MTTLITAAVSGNAVGLVVSTDAPGAALVDVSRGQRGNTGPVMGGQGAELVAGGWTGTDYEVLYGAPAIYAARVMDGFGTVLESASASAVVVAEDRVWLIDTTIGAGQPVQLVGQDAGDDETDTRTSLLRPLGRRRPIAITDTRSGSAGAMRVLTSTARQEGALRALLSTGRVLMATGPAHWHLLFPLYVTVGRVRVARVSGAMDEAREFTWDWTQVDRPGGQAAQAPASWGSYVAAGVTWQDWIDGSKSWGDVIYGTRSAGKGA